MTSVWFIGIRNQTLSCHAGSGCGHVNALWARCLWEIVSIKLLSARGIEVVVSSTGFLLLPPVSAPSCTLTVSTWVNFLHNSVIYPRIPRRRDSSTLPGYIKSAYSSSWTSTVARFDPSAPRGGHLFSQYAIKSSLPSFRYDSPLVIFIPSTTEGPCSHARALTP